MAVDQSFLEGLRTQAGLGTGNFTRTADARSADQNNTTSGNPMQLTTRPPQYVAPNRRAPNTVPMTQQQAYSGAYQPGMFQQPQQNLYGQALAAMPNLGGFNTPGGMNGLGTMMGAPGMQMSGGIPGQPARFVAPQMNGGGPIPDQMAQRNVVGSRFVRPMAR